MGVTSGAFVRLSLLLGCLTSCEGRDEQSTEDSELLSKMGSEDASAKQHVHLLLRISLILAY